MRHAPKAGVRHLRTVREILASHVPTLYNVIALLCAAVLLAAGDSFQLSFLPMALLHAALCIGAELCFRRAMRRLEAPEPPVVVLAGEGHETRPGAAVAEGDRLRLDAGSPVPADRTVAQGAVLADTSLLDGRSAHAPFAAGDTLWAGATVVQGACEADVTAAGARTRLYRTELDARQRQEPRSEMARGLTRLIRVLALLSLPLCLCKYLLYVRRGSDALSAGVSAVSSLMGMLPAALLLLSAAAMLLSTAVLRRRQVLARDLYSVEMFGRIDTLCFDKTGTLTCGTAADVLRGEARETVAYFRAEGVDVRLLTGDTPEAAAAIARALHLEGPLVDCAGLSDEALAAATAYAGVFASATAGQKAQLVLLDENLLSLPDIVREGRSIIGSVTRTSELFVKKSLTSMIVLLIALITPLEYPFLPRQLTLVALFTIGLPALALTFERESAPAHGHFVGSVFFEAVAGHAAEPAVRRDRHGVRRTARPLGGGTHYALRLCLCALRHARAAAYLPSVRPQPGAAVRGDGCRAFAFARAAAGAALARAADACHAARAVAADRAGLSDAVFARARGRARVAPPARAGARAPGGRRGARLTGRRPGAGGAVRAGRAATASRARLSPATPPLCRQFSEIFFTA